MSGLYVAFEGIDGAGKSTVAEAVAAEFRAEGHEVVTVREPGGTEVGEAIRQVLLHSHDELELWAEALLFAAARAQLVKEIVAPLLAQGVWVFSDRSVYSSLAYQGAGRGLGIEEVRHVNATGLQGTWPDVVVLLELDPAEGLRRQEVPDRIGGEGLDLQERVAAAYDALADQGQFLRVDGSRDLDLVVRDSVEAIRERL